MPSASGLCCCFRRRFEEPSGKRVSAESAVAAIYWVEQKPYIGTSAVAVPRLPKSFPKIPFRNVYCLICGTNRTVAI
jgi:hypothetical protein